MSAADGDKAETSPVTVKVRSGPTRDSYDDIVDAPPDTYEMEVHGDDVYYVPHEDHVVLDDNIENHKKYAFAVDSDRPVELIVETSDHYHDTIEGFESGCPLENGLTFDPTVDADPFKVEMWGCVRMRVEE